MKTITKKDLFFWNFVKLVLLIPKLILVIGLIFGLFAHIAYSRIHIIPILQEYWDYWVVVINFLIILDFFRIKTEILFCQKILLVGSVSSLITTLLFFIIGIFWHESDLTLFGMSHGWHIVLEVISIMAMIYVMMEYKKKIKLNKGGT